MGEQKPLIKVGIVLVVAFFTMIFIPLLGLYLFSGADSELLKAMVYYSTGGGALLGLVGLGILNWSVSKGWLSYDKWGWLSVFIFEPEQSMFADSSAKKYLTFWNIFHFSIIFGLILSLIAAVTQTFFVALPSVEFQITETGQLILSAEPAASAETLVMLVIISLLAGITTWYVKKNKLPGATRIIFLFFSALITMAIWAGIHYVRYGSQETTFFATALFGFLGSFISFLTGTALTWYIWHFFNNLFLKASEIFSSDIVVAVIVVFLSIYITILLIFKSYKYISKKK